MLKLQVNTDKGDVRSGVLFIKSKIAINAARLFLRQPRL